MKSSFLLLSEEKDSLLDSPTCLFLRCCVQFILFFLYFLSTMKTQQSRRKSILCCVGCATNLVNIFIKCHALSWRHRKILLLLNPWIFSLTSLVVLPFSSLNAYMITRISRWMPNCFQIHQRRLMCEKWQSVNGKQKSQSPQGTVKGKTNRFPLASSPLTFVPTYFIKSNLNKRTTMWWWEI